MIDTKQLSKLIQMYCKTSEARDLFYSFKESEDPDQGACFAVAEAMRRIAKSGELVAIGTTRHYEEAYGKWVDHDIRFNYGHVLLKIGNIYFDGFGSYSLSKLRDQIKKDEDAIAQERGYKPDYKRWVINPVTISEVEASEIDTSEENVVKILEGLRDILPKFFMKPLI